MIKKSSLGLLTSGVGGLVGASQRPHSFLETQEGKNKRMGMGALKGMAVGVPAGIATGFAGGLGLGIHSRLTNGSVNFNPSVKALLLMTLLAKAAQAGGGYLGGRYL